MLESTPALKALELSPKCTPVETIRNGEKSAVRGLRIGSVPALHYFL
jgi:hypothetical protein